MKKLPIPDNESQRLKALKDYNILDTINEIEFDRLTELAAIICDVPIALISLIDEKRQWFKSNVGLDATETPRDISFCQYTIMGNEVFEVTDAKNDDRFSDNPLVTSNPEISFYAGYPLTDPDGMNLGSFCVIDKSPKKLDTSQLKALEVLGKEVIAQIVARKQNEERVKLEKLFNYSLDLICIAGTDGYFKKINPRFMKILGYTEEELLTTSFLDLVHEEDKAKTVLELEKLANGENTLNFENRFVKKDESYVTLNWLANPDADTGELYAIARDITDKVLILKELKEAKNLAEKSVSVKDEFLSNMSHEIRTPLNAIIGFNNLLKQSPLTAEQEKHVEIVRVASQNLMVIINDILDVSKLESGKLELEKRPISIKAIAENVINLQSQKAKEKGLKLLLSVDQDIPVSVTGDSTRTSQILINLIGNAIKFTNQGYVELRIMEMKRTEKESLIRFSIKDTGVGIDRQKQQIIFERFSQAETSTTRVFGGTGLGLNISKMLVAMLGGKIELESELGKGSEFSFEINFMISNAIEIRKVPKNISVEYGNNLAGRSILVVEDNEHNQLLAQSYLNKNGSIVSLADNGAIALEMLKHHTYDLILMDLQMPVMDGFTATKIIRDELKLDVPIIACSAHSLIGERQNCIEKGMNDYISKPFSEENMIDVLCSFLNHTSNPQSHLDDFKNLLGITEKKHGKDYLDMMLEIYNRRIPTDIVELEEAIEAKNADIIKSKAHLLSGSLSSFNFELGNLLAKDTEKSASNGDFEETKHKTRLLIDYLKTSLETIGA